MAPYRSTHTCQVDWLSKHVLLLGPGPVVDLCEPAVGRGLSEGGGGQEDINPTPKHLTEVLGYQSPHLLCFYEKVIIVPAIGNKYIGVDVI